MKTQYTKKPLIKLDRMLRGFGTGIAIGGGSSCIILIAAKVAGLL